MLKFYTVSSLSNARNAFNPSSLEAQAGGLQSQPQVIQRETLSQNKSENKGRTKLPNFKQLLKMEMFFVYYYGRLTLFIKTLCCTQCICTIRYHLCKNWRGWACGEIICLYVRRKTNHSSQFYYIGPRNQQEVISYLGGCGGYAWTANCIFHGLGFFISDLCELHPIQHWIFKFQFWSVKFSF